MLVAYGPENAPVVAEETPLEQLHHWSHERALHCPNCRGIVHVRGGPEKRTQLHFAHQKGECAWSTEGESVRHMRGKMVLAHWLREQFPQAVITLEERLPEPNRIADVFVQHADGQRWAVEFQCAPLELDEWQRRHQAYRNANVIDLWIIGNNRREKQEAFIEAVITLAHEVMFLDPLATPPHIWLRWPISRETVRKWELETARTPSLEGWVGRLGYGATLLGQLHDVRMGERCELIHPARSALELRTQLLHTMSIAASVDEAVLSAYLHQTLDERTMRVVIRPLVWAYVRDPELLRRYNYGRGRADQPLSEEDRQRVQQARGWLVRLEQQGFSPPRLRELAKEIPFVGPYAALAGYLEMLIIL